MNKKIIYDLILGVLLIVTFFCIGSLFLEVNDNLSHSERKDVSLWCYVENGKYYQLCEDVKYNKLVQARETDLFKKCETIADYFMAANNYKINSELGREAEAKQYKKEMEGLLLDLEKIDFDVEDIHQKLKIPY